MVVAGEGDIRIDAGVGEGGEVVVGAVAGVGEEASRGTPGVGPDLLDETGQRAGVGRVRGHGGGDDHLRGLVHDRPTL